MLVHLREEVIDRLWRRQCACRLLTALRFCLLGRPGLSSSTDLFPTLLADHTQGQWNRSKASDQDQSPSGSFALIIIEPGAKQKAIPVPNATRVPAMRMISTRVSFRSIISQPHFRFPHRSRRENKFTPGQHGADEGALLTLPCTATNRAGCVSPIRKWATHPNLQRITSVLPVTRPELVTQVCPGSPLQLRDK
jgi:hypothetical protein